MTEGSEKILRVTPGRELAEEWELVLLAQGLSPRVRPAPDGVALSVPEHEAERALGALAAYESENPPERESHDDAAGSGSFLAAIAAAAMVMAFFFATAVWDPAAPWFERGGADADRIVRGEVWRTVTALTLHADFAHAATNAVALFVFLGALSGILGPGLAAALVLLAGAGGNLANALAHGSLHVAVGASTAVFGAVGMLGSLGVARRLGRKGGRRRAWMPLAAAIALLAMLGTAGERVDVWAHLFGLTLGGVLGILIVFVAPPPPGVRVQWALGGAALVAIVYSWILALG